MVKVGGLAVVDVAGEPDGWIVWEEKVANLLAGFASAGAAGAGEGAGGVVNGEVEGLIGDDGCGGCLIGVEVADVPCRRVDAG